VHFEPTIATSFVVVAAGIVFLQSCLPAGMHAPPPFLHVLSRRPRGSCQVAHPVSQ
jgi:hypothetical protein